MSRYNAETDSTKRAVGIGTGAPDKVAFLADIENGFSIRDLARKYEKCSASIRHWLKKYGVKTKRTGYFPHENPNEDRACLLCHKPGSTYGGRKRWLCPGCYTKVRRFRNKSRAIEYLGGKCIDCGWQGHLAGFHFHHKADSKKEFVISRFVNKAWTVVEKELDKCELLCATCHSIRHAMEESELLLSILAKYQGKLGPIKRRKAEKEQCDVV